MARKVFCTKYVLAVKDMADETACFKEILDFGLGFAPKLFSGSKKSQCIREFCVVTCGRCVGPS